MKQNGLNAVYQGPHGWGRILGKDQFYRYNSDESSKCDAMSVRRIPFEMESTDWNLFMSNKYLSFNSKFPNSAFYGIGFKSAYIWN
jgi:hypothetical protein